MYAFFCVLGTNGFSQEDYFLTAQEKAYMFHTVRKSPILERNIGRYFVYTGEEIKFVNGEINYDSTELTIINQPDLLHIYSDEMRRSPKGILAELANKVALYQLNKALNSNAGNTLAEDGNERDFESFNEKAIQRMPVEALETKKDVVSIKKKVEKIINPSLALRDKLAMLNSFSTWSMFTKKQVLEAYNVAINEWVAERSEQIFRKLGGEATVFKNSLTAVGDGSSTSGLLEEREKDENGRWNKGLPKAVGLFPYELEVKNSTDSKKLKQEIVSSGYTVFGFTTPGKGRETNIHLDVWGYNSTKQTTVVIQKGRYSYPLFGSENTRFLSPDSTFGGGTTYYSLIKKIQVDIDSLDAKITGKRGFDYWIAYYEEKRDQAKLNYDRTEKQINDIRSTSLETNANKLKGTKSAKKNKNPNSSTLLKSESNGKMRAQKQEKVVGLYDAINRYKVRVEKLKAQKEEAIEKMRLLESRKQTMLDRIGQYWMPFKEKEGLYIFEDSSRFDLFTQEFTFPATDREVPFEVKLIGMPLSPYSNQYDEVMLHINVTDAMPNYRAKLQLNLNDVFGVDEYQLKETQLLTQKDSIGVSEFFEALLEAKKEFKIIARGGGIGKMKNESVVIDYEPEELSQYPGNSAEERAKSKESEAYKSLRKTQINITIDRAIVLEINSFTDPVKSNFTVPNAKNRGWAEKYNLSGNQLLSAYRTFQTLSDLRNELTLLAGKYLNRQEASKVIDRLNKTIDKTKVTVGKTSIKWKSF